MHAKGDRNLPGQRGRQCPRTGRYRAPWLAYLHVGANVRLGGMDAGEREMEAWRRC